MKQEVSRTQDRLLYPWFVVALLMLAYVCSFIDRQILSLLIGPIREDLQISDTQFGLLHGMAFALFYATLGMPIARLADRHSRPLIISVGVCFWSLATAACGLANSFVQLLLARIGVGAGEAALSPAAYSIMGDYFPPHKLGLALAVYSTGPFVGAGLAFMLGGAIIQAISAAVAVTVPIIGVLAPWQLTFVIVGLPGVVIALLIHLFVRDPIRREIAMTAPIVNDGLLAFMGRHKKVFWCHMVGYSMTAMALFTLMGWAPAFLMRVFAIEPHEAGYVLGPTMMIGCTAGVLFSGWLMDRQRTQGRIDAPMRLGMVGALGTLVAIILLPFTSSLAMATAALVVVLFFASFPLPLSTAAIQVLTPNRLRAQVSALLLLCNSFLGLALGSVLVGALNDYVFKTTQMVGTAMSIVVAGASVIGALLLWLGCQPFRASVAAIQARTIQKVTDEVLA